MWQQMKKTIYLQYNNNNLVVTKRKGGQIYGKGRRFDFGW